MITGRVAVALGVAAMSMLACSGTRSALAGNPLATKFTKADMFRYARQHNVRALTGMANLVKASHDSNLNAAYAYALYIADSSRFGSYYAEQFPTTTTGIMDGLGTLGYVQRLFGPLDPFVAISKLAEHGNLVAIKKVLNAATHSDGSVAEYFDGEVFNLLVSIPQETIKALSSLSTRDAHAIICHESKTWGPREVTRLTKRLGQLKSTTLREKELMSRISSTRPCG